MKVHLWKVILILLLSLCVLGGVASAQGGGILNYGDTVSHQLDSGAPQALYSFTGNAGDVVTVYALGWAAEFQPAITILGPTGQVGFSNTDALTPIGNDARVTVALPQAGSYSVLVASASDSLGQFTLALRLTTPQIVIPLNEAVSVNFPAGAEAQAFSIAGAGSALQISSSTPGFAFAGYISAPDGHILAAFDGALPVVNLSLPPASAEDGPYLLILYGADSTQTGSLYIQPGAGSGSLDIQPPAATEEASTDNTDTQAPAPPADQCAAVAGEQGLNVRRGPGTNFDIITTLLPGQYLIVNGQNSGWYTGNALGEQGWVAGSVITLTGPCSNLPLVQAPAPPSNPTPPPSQPTATESTSATPTPSPTTDSGLTPPAATEDAGPTPTATFTQPVQTAPPDNQHNLNIDRDDGGQLTNAVSYPSGDVSDRVRMTINNLTNFTPNNTRTVILTLVCTGSGTGNISWGTGGPSSPTPLACGQSTSSFHTYDSNQTFVNINMAGPGYVTWTLVATTSQ